MHQPLTAVYAWAHARAEAETEWAIPSVQGVNVRASQYWTVPSNEAGSGFSPARLAATTGEAAASRAEQDQHSPGASEGPDLDDRPAAPG